MENKNIILGKIDKKVCYLNNGQYGYYLSFNKVNYKVPEWMPHDKMDIDIAERLIEYKNKLAQQYQTSKEIIEKIAAKDLEALKKKEEEEEDESTDEEPQKLSLSKNKSKK